MSSKNKERFPKHMMGKNCGYELYEDGSIEIAPTHADAFSRADKESKGLRLLVDAINAHLAQQYQHVAALQDAFWEGVKQDYSLDFEKYDYSYRSFDRRISRKEKEKKK